MVGVETPISLIAKRWTPSTRMVKRAALSAVGMSVFIIVTGGAVRLTGSGLGCDTWPKCTDDSLFATPEQGLHGAIEFGNSGRRPTRCSAAVGWAIVATSSMKPRRRKLTRLAWAQFWIVLANAVLGGITVWAGLNPWTVAGHFLLANLLLAVAVITWVRVALGLKSRRPLRVGTRRPSRTPLTEKSQQAPGRWGPVKTCANSTTLDVGDTPSFAGVGSCWG
ncbi:heme A synthase [Streptomyces californicus]